MRTIAGLPFNKNDTSNATVTIETPSTAQNKLKLRMLGFSANPTTTDSITFYFGSRAIWGPIYCDGITNGVFDYQELKFEGEPGESLKVVKGSAGTLLTVYGIKVEE